MPALLCVSDCGALILRLRMPPFALISSIASSAPSRKLVPDTAPAPESSITIGMFTVCCACTGAAPSASVPAAIAPIQIAFTSPPPLNALELQNVETRVRVGQVHQPTLVDVAV